MTYRLALIGRDISHSKSKLIYESILSVPVDYTLIDCSQEFEIPPVNELLSEYSGISITAPYKKHFIKEVVLTPEAKQTSAVNCLYRGKTGPMGTNTDFVALKKLVPQMVKECRPNKIVLLGSGTMAKVISICLNDLDCNFISISRKSNGPIEDFDLNSVGKQLLVINCCHRDFVFRGDISRDSTFWDLNYSHSHSELLSERCTYIDGEQLLFEQAKVALSCWGIVESKKI